MGHVGRMGEEIGANSYQYDSDLTDIGLVENLPAVIDCLIIRAEGIKKGDCIRRSTSVTDGVFDGRELFSIMIPWSTVMIEDGAFSNCKELKGVTIQEGLKVMGSEVFLSCDELVEINLPSSLEIISDSIFKGCKRLNILKIPAGSSEMYKTIFGDKFRLEEYKVAGAANTVYSATKEADGRWYVSKIARPKTSINLIKAKELKQAGEILLREYPFIDSSLSFVEVRPFFTPWLLSTEYLIKLLLDRSQVKAVYRGDETLGELLGKCEIQLLQGSRVTEMVNIMEPLLDTLRLGLGWGTSKILSSRDLCRFMWLLEQEINSYDEGELGKRI